MSIKGSENSLLFITSFNQKRNNAIGLEGEFKESGALNVQEDSRFQPTGTDVVSNHLVIWVDCLSGKADVNLSYLDQYSLVPENSWQSRGHLGHDLVCVIWNF